MLLYSVNDSMPEASDCHSYLPSSPTTFSLPATLILAQLTGAEETTWEKLKMEMCSKFTNGGITKTFSETMRFCLFSLKEKLSVGHGFLEAESWVTNVQAQRTQDVIPGSWSSRERWLAPCLSLDKAYTLPGNSVDPERSLLLDHWAADCWTKLHGADMLETK